MAEDSRTFSESWHRVADLRVGLRPDIPIRKQMFKGEIWYILQDSFNNLFFRFRPGAYEFIVRLRKERTVAQVWEDCMAHNPDGAPGQDDVIALLAQLYHANLIFCNLPADSRKLFERHHRRRQNEIRSQLLGIMFYRIPLFDPEPLLRRCSLLVRLFTSRFAVLLWFLTVGFAVKTVFEQFPDVVHEAKTVLDFHNLALFYFGLVLVKTLHEFGHTMVCKRFGGEVHTMGIMLILFAPLPYMDATSSWGFRNRWQRILVAASGMVFELFAASIAALLWANSGPGIIHSLAFNIMIVASVSTILFNANPLLRWDGYYILSDFLDIPNLQPRSQEQLQHLAEYYLFGNKQSTSPADTRREAFWFAVYGVLSGLYRFIVYTGILLFVANRFLIAGLLIAVVCVFSWAVVPASRFISYLASSPKLAKNRTRATAVSLMLFGVALFALSVIPFPNRFRAPGVLEAKKWTWVTNSAAGNLTQILSENGSRVEKGEPLLELENPELDIEIVLIKAQQKEVMALLQQSAVVYKDRTRAALEERQASLDSKLHAVEKKRQNLLIRAEQTGIWVAPFLNDLKGSWVKRGRALGKIISPERFMFSAVVTQEEAANLFSEKISGDAIVRLFGQGSVNLPVKGYRVIPFQQERLPSAALGRRAGGEIPVAAKDEKGLQAVEPFFQIFAEIETNSGTSVQMVLHHGHSGKIRFSMQPKPLLSQILRKARQFFQKRYQI